jgi:hypothetical protein
MADEQQNETVRLQAGAPDYVTAAAKAALGVIPFAGSLLAEVAGAIIPNQRIDRVVKFAVILEQKLSDLEKASARLHLTDENFTDLLEESIRQVARSVTDERRDYIASVLTHGIKSENIQFIESKHLLRILGEINDIEVVWLKFYLVAGLPGDEDFRRKHADILQIPQAYMGAPQDVLDKNALKDSYLQHLAKLGLLEETYATIPQARTRHPVTGAPTVLGYQLTRLGKLLLRHIGLAGNENRLF